MRADEYRLRHEEDEDESAFVTMTDMPVSILFILLILLAFFVSQLRPDTEHQIDRMEEELKQLETENKELLSTLSVLSEDQRSAADALLDLKRTKRELEALRQQLAETQDRLKSQTALEADMNELRRRVALLDADTINPLQAYNSEVASVRRQLLLRLQAEINQEFPKLEVRLSAAEDALQFVGEGLFASGSQYLSPQSLDVVRRLAEIVDDALLCFTVGPRSDFFDSCNSGFAIVEALQIEGHTDSDGTQQSNVLLGTQRAAATYGAMIQHRTGLIDHLNLQGQPVLSVAGYGEDRPVASNETPQGKSLNRRIDLRFIMLRPSEVDDIEQISDALRTGTAKPEVSP